MIQASAKPATSLLNPADHTLLMIDHQPQMAFATRSIDVAALRTNAAMVAEAAAGFGVDTILTTVAEKTFSGPIFEEVSKPFPKHHVIDRTTMNCFEEPKVVDWINALGKTRLVLAGLWTSVCIAGPALTALEQGFEVYLIADACGDVTTEAHDLAMHRMMLAGARPMTSLAYLLELQRDWARGETYALTTGIAARLGGGYGLGLIYVGEMFGGHES
ncbi:MAG TPA: isochorismatase family protein [Terriglobales bacterium]|nr:isochorismatase family protein [Terriglobales bacterium]